jgi:hypothetical protein
MKDHVKINDVNRKCITYEDWVLFVISSVIEFVLLKYESV